MKDYILCIHYETDVHEEVDHVKQEGNTLEEACEQAKKIYQKKHPKRKVIDVWEDPNYLGPVVLVSTKGENNL